MGLGIPKAHRDLVTASSRALEATRSGRRYKTQTKTISRQQISGSNIRNIIWPKAGHRAGGDAPALIRSNVIKMQTPFSDDVHLTGRVNPAPKVGRSACQIAQSVFNTLNESKPGEIDIFFDLADSSQYPPQRALVAAKRNAKPVASSAITTVLEQLGCTSVLQAEALDTDHVPLLMSRLIDWAVVFSIPALKPFAWRVFQSALKTTIAKITLKKGCAPLTVRIWCTDGITCHTLTTTSIKTTISAKPLFDFGEADLRVFNCAARANILGQEVVVHSIDTDFFVMAIASVWFTPNAAFLLRMKTDVYDVRELIKIAGDKTARLNMAFWLLAFGCDYSNSLTNNGHLSKTLLHLVQNERRGPYADKDSTATFNVADAHVILDTLKRTKKTKAPPKSIETTLNDMHFCVRYYGFLFDHFVSSEMAFTVDAYTLQFTTSMTAKKE